MKNSLKRLNSRFGWQKKNQKNRRYVDREYTKQKEKNKKKNEQSFIIKTFNKQGTEVN